MTCFKTGWAALLDAQFWESLTSIASPIIAIVAIGAVFYQIREARIESKRAIAHAAYDRYLELCLENTKFSCGYSKSIYPNEDEIYKKYCWFVSTMLFAFEQILAVYPHDKEWKETIRSQLRRHKRHLSHSGTVERKEWNEQLMMLINNIIEETQISRL